MKKLALFAMISLLCSCTIDRCKFKFTFENPSSGYLCLYDQELDMVLDSIDLEEDEEALLETEIDEGGTYILKMNIADTMHEPLVTQMDVTEAMSKQSSYSINNKGEKIGEFAIQPHYKGVWLIVLIILAIPSICWMIVMFSRKGRGKKEEKKEMSKSYVDQVMEQYHIPTSTKENSKDISMRSDSTQEIANNQEVEETQRKADEDAKRKAELARKKAEAKRKAAEVAKRKAAEEEARLRAEEEARLKAEEEAKRKAEEEAKRRAEEEAKRKAKEEAKRKAEEEAKRKAEEEVKRKAEEEAKRLAEFETKERIRIEEEMRKEMGL